MTDLSEKVSNGYFIVLLTSGNHVIFEEFCDKEPIKDPFTVRYWNHPCHINYDSNTKSIRFMPMVMFANIETIKEIDDRHIIIRYRPEKDIVEAYKEFVTKFHQKMAENQKPGMTANGKMSVH